MGWSALASAGVKSTSLLPTLFVPQMIGTLLRKAAVTSLGGPLKATSAASSLERRTGRVFPPCQECTSCACTILMEAQSPLGRLGSRLETDTSFLGQKETGLLKVPRR